MQDLELKIEKIDNKNRELEVKIVEEETNF